MLDNTSMIWGIAVVGGTLALGVALFTGWLRARKVDDEIDPNTPADDPSKGMR